MIVERLFRAKLRSRNDSPCENRLVDEGSAAENNLESPLDNLASKREPTR